MIQLVENPEDDEKALFYEKPVCQGFHRNDEALWEA